MTGKGGSSSREQGQIWAHPTGYVEYFKGREKGKERGREGEREACLSADADRI